MMTKNDANTSIAVRKVVLFDTEKNYRDLLPLSYTRPIGAFRLGIDTLVEKWQAFLPGSYSWLTRPYLMEKFPEDTTPEGEALFIAGNLVADASLAADVEALKPGEGYCDEIGLWAWRGTLTDFLALTDHSSDSGHSRDSVCSNESGMTLQDTRGRRINYIYDLFLQNPRTLVEDYMRMFKGKRSDMPDCSVTVIGPMELADGTPALMIEEGAELAGCTLNLKGGPIYIGKGAQVMEGACLRGPLAVGPGTRVRMGSKIYGGTTFGPNCRIGGEVDNSVVFGYSNKAHDGYLGNAVVGEWCNIGAGANASNLKNDYSKIRIWNYNERRFMRTDLQFCGLIMGDHSKAAINSMFNTATVIGVGVNFHGAGFPRPFIASFQTGSPEGGFTDVPVSAFFKIAKTVMGRRGIELTDVDRRIFDAIYATASEFK